MCIRDRCNSDIYFTLVKARKKDIKIMKVTKNVLLKNDVCSFYVIYIYTEDVENFVFLFTISLFVYKI